MAKDKAATDPDAYDPDDYKAESDARTLQQAEEIKGDPKRHQAAVTHLGKMRDNLVAAHANARRALVRKTGGRLKKAFGQQAGEEDGETPFEKAGQNAK